MIKMFAFGALALTIAAPAAAQMSPAPGGPLPKCSATVRDSCDQSTTTQKYALSADQAMKTGGVGDRKSDNAAAMSAAPKPMMHKHKAMHHKAMMKHTTTSTDAAPDAAAKPM